MFLSKLTHTEIGLTAWDMFVINKPTLLTVTNFWLKLNKKGYEKKAEMNRDNVVSRHSFLLTHSHLFRSIKKPKDNKFLIQIISQC